MAVTIKTLIDSVSTTLVDEGFTRWSKAELIGYLNEAYTAFVTVKPDCSVKVANMNAASGSLQSIPNDGVSLLEVLSNNGRTVTPVDRKIMDQTHWGWEAESESDEIYHYIFDEMSPKQFRTYPPAMVGASLTIRYISIPSFHAEGDYESGDINLPDEYLAPLKDYMLYRAFSKDSESVESMNRSTQHFNLANSYLGGQLKMAMITSPNK